MTGHPIEGGIKIQNEAGNVTPNISIIIATFNVAETLQICLNSIYRQEYQDTEIVIMDGGSIDGTREILKKNSDRIYYWRSEKDDGIYYAFNKALNYIRGRWVIFLGADDELLPGFSLMAKELHDESSIHYGSVLYKNRKCSGFISPYKFAKLGLQHQATFYPRTVFNKYTYDVNYKISADYILNIHCYSDDSIGFTFRDYITARYNHTGISATTEDLLLKDTKSGLIFKHFGFLIWLRYQVKVVKTLLK